MLFDHQLKSEVINRNATTVKKKFNLSFSGANEVTLDSIFNFYRKNDQ